MQYLLSLLILSSSRYIHYWSEILHWSNTFHIYYGRPLCSSPLPHTPSSSRFCFSKTRAAPLSTLWNHSQCHCREQQWQRNRQSEFEPALVWIPWRLICSGLQEVLVSVSVKSHVVPAAFSLKPRSSAKYRKGRDRIVREYLFKIDTTKNANKLIFHASHWGRWKWPDNRLEKKISNKNAFL